jgi:predicted phage terminase large subunit-like protein
MKISKVDAAKALKLRRQMREHLNPFVGQVFKTVEPGKEYKYNWHIGLIAEYLEGIYRGELNRLIINIQPRSLKSTITSVAFPAWVLGKDPTKQFMCCSYAEALTLKLSVNTREVMQQPWYKHTFPDTRLKGGQTEKSQFWTTEKGYRIARTVNGSTLGDGGDILICDDPIKREDAHSETIRKKTNEWITQSFLTRLNDRKTGSVVLIMQRLHQNDPTGFLLDLGGWEHLKIPTIAPSKKKYSFNSVEKEVKADEILQPEREDEETLAQAKIDLGTYGFSGQYQQTPHPEGGGIIKQKWWQYHVALPMHTFRIIQVWDTAFKDKEENDYSVCATWYEGDHMWYLDDLYRGKPEFPELLVNMEAQYQKHRPHVVVVEDKASGQSAIQTMKRKTKIPIVGHPAERDSIARAHAVTPMIQAGNCSLRQDAPWLADFLEEHNAFPKSTFKDQVLTTLIFLEYIKDGMSTWDGPYEGEVSTASKGDW